MTPLEDRMIQKERLFVDHYIVHMNKSAAAEHCGYATSCAHSIGAEIYQRPHVRAEINRRLDAASVHADIKAADVLRELGRLAFANNDDYFEDDGNGHPKMVAFERLTRDQKAAISEMTIVERRIEPAHGRPETITKTRFKLADKTQALALLGKHLQLFEEKKDPHSESAREAIFNRAVRTARRMLEGHAQPGNDGDGPLLVQDRSVFPFVENPPS